MLGGDPMRGDCPFRDDPLGGFVCRAKAQLINESFCLRCPLASPLDIKLAEKRPLLLAVLPSDLFQTSAIPGDVHGSKIGLQELHEDVTRGMPAPG
jgi:hypothetical protein